MQSNQASRRIAMWSPPRARSTMMMRVFEALGCAVFDEPFYPYWLKTLNLINDPGCKQLARQMREDLYQRLKDTGGLAIPLGHKRGEGTNLRRTDGSKPADFPERLMR